MWEATVPPCCSCATRVPSVCHSRAVRVPFPCRSSAGSVPFPCCSRATPVPFPCRSCAAPVSFPCRSCAGPVPFVCRSCAVRVLFVWSGTRISQALKKNKKEAPQQWLYAWFLLPVEQNVYECKCHGYTLQRKSALKNILAKMHCRKNNPAHWKGLLQFLTFDLWIMGLPDL